MQLLFAIFGLLLLIPAALAGISAGLRDLAANGDMLGAQLHQLMAVGATLWPVCCALGLITAGSIALSVGIWLLVRGLQSRV